jgi:dolichol-phosphate mannosyltransferase
LAGDIPTAAVCGKSAPTAAFVGILSLSVTGRVSDTHIRWLTHGSQKRRLSAFIQLKILQNHISQYNIKSLIPHLSGELILKVVVIIPTYNEADNITPLLEAIGAQFCNIPHQIEVLVVDDNSPDGTADRVRAFMDKAPWVYMIEGTKEGLGVAYIRGMRHANRVLGADAVVEMDADFSHKPEDLPRLLAELDKGEDFVIGSRYVEGGSIPDNWGLYRKAVSYFGNLVARLIVGLKVRDCTAGFRVIRSDILESINLDHLAVKGYAFQVALLNRCINQGAKVKEVPVDFIDRERGESKLGISDVLEFMLNVWWIRLQNHGTFVKFAIVGLSGVLVNLGSFTLLLGLGLSKYISSPIAIEVSILWNFFLNNTWTFRWRESDDSIQLKGAKFNAVSLVALLVSFSTFVALSKAFPTLPPQLSQAAGIVPALFVNYFLNAYWTFKSVSRQADNA